MSVDFLQGGSRLREAHRFWLRRLLKLARAGGKVKCWPVTQMFLVGHFDFDFLMCHAHALRAGVFLTRNHTPARSAWAWHCESPNWN